MNQTAVDRLGSGAASPVALCPEGTKKKQTDLGSDRLSVGLLHEVTLVAASFQRAVFSRPFLWHKAHKYQLITLGELTGKELTYAEQDGRRTNTEE